MIEVTDEEVGMPNQQEQTEQVDAEKVAHMRELLSKPGGEAEVARRYGEDATSSEEFRTAQRQQKAAADRAREMRLEAAKEAERAAERAQGTGTAHADRAEASAVSDRLDEANKALDKNRAVIKDQVERARGQVQMQSM